jgi:hypothetical protein
MATRRRFVLVLAGLFALPSALWGASARSTNFVVEAPTPQIAQQVTQYAEQYRREKAQLWLGREMPTWPQPLPIRVTVTMGGAGGATSFAFDNGQILHQQMHIEGSLERLLNSVLPHEVTHTVFAHHFRCPVPRWADEGGAVLSEDDIERDRHDKMVRQILNSGRAIPLRRLLSLREYPNEVMALYAEGFSVTSFLVGRSSRPAFLNFVGDGMRRGWDAALQTHYQIRNVEELEQAWLTHLRNTRRQPAQLASNTQPAAGDSSRQLLVRQTVPPAQPLDTPRAVVRGVAPEQDRDYPGAIRPVSRPGYLPDYTPATGPVPEGFQSPAPQPPPPGPVRLGAPVFEAPAPPPPAQLGRPIPGPASPVGYPN